MIMSYNMSDDEWRNLCQIILLPDAARDRIQQAIRRYKRSAGLVFDPAASRSDMAGAQSALKKARKLIEKLRNDRLACFVISRNIEAFSAPSPGDASKIYLSKFIESLDTITSVLEKSAPQIMGAKPGAHIKSILVSMLVSELNTAMIDHLGRPITRSGKKTDRSKQYVEAVCKLADAKIRPYSIDEAMKRVIRTRRTIRMPGRISFRKAR